MKKQCILSLLPLALAACATPGTSSRSSSSAFSSELSSEAGTSSLVSSSAIESSAPISSSEPISSVEGLTSDDSAWSQPQHTGLFDIQTNLSFDLEIPEDSLNFINDYQYSKDSIYRDAYLPATLTMKLGEKTTVFEEVGVRLKGNMSRTNIIGWEDYLNPVHFKINFKATFDSELYDEEPLRPFKKTWEDADAKKARKKRTCDGYSKLDFKYIPRNDSLCVIRDIYCYQSFENAGIMAPSARTCGFSFGNENHEKYVSAYQVIETIDKDFLERRLGKAEAKGDLYKCVYNGMGKADFSRDGAVNKDVVSNLNVGERVEYGKIGVEDALYGYSPVYQLKTNDDLGEGSDFSNMVNLINTLWNSVYGSGTKADLEKALDVEEFLKFSAISYLLGNFDDQRYNYNNFYLYFAPNSKKAIFIPYDWDWSLGAGYSGEALYEMGPMDEWTLDGNGPSNVFKATFLGKNLGYDMGDYAQQYLAYVHSYKDKVLDASAFDQLSNDLGGSDYENQQVHAYMSAKLGVLRD